MLKVGGVVVVVIVSIIPILDWEEDHFTAAAVAVAVLVLVLVLILVESLDTAPGVKALTTDGDDFFPRNDFIEIGCCCGCWSLS